MSDHPVPPIHGAPPPAMRAQIEGLIEEAAPVFDLALRSPLFGRLGADGAAVILVDTARRGRFLGRAERSQVLLDGRHFTIAVVPRADAVLAVAEACAHCAAQLDACYAFRSGPGTLVAHVDVEALGAVSAILGAQLRSVH